MAYDLSITGESVGSIIKNFTKGVNVLPIFQREYVWNKDNAQKLADSILKGIPIGNMFFWTTEDNLHTIKYEGVEDGRLNREKHYIVDGGQRTVTLYGLSNGGEIGGVNFDDFYIDSRGNRKDFIDGSVSVYTLNEIKREDKENLKWYLPIKYYFWKPLNGSEMEEFRENKENYDRNRYEHRGFFVNEEFHELLEGMEELTAEDKIEIRNNLSTISTVLLERQVSVTRVEDGSLEEVLDLFERTNQEGIELSEVEVLNASLYDVNTGFYYSEELEKIAEEVYEDFGVTLVRGKKEPYKMLNNIVMYTLFGSYKKRYLYTLEKRFNSTILRGDWGDVKRAIYNATEEVGYYKNLDIKNMYKDLPLYIWSYFFYKNNNELQTNNQQKSMDTFLARITMTSFLDRTGQAESMMSLNKVIDKIVNDKDEEYYFDVDDIKSMYSSYPLVTDIIKDSYKNTNRNSVFNMKWFLIQEIRGNKDLLTGRKIEGFADKLEICHIFPENTDGELSNNVFNFVRQPKEVNDYMGHKHPRSWIDRANRESLDSLFIDDECIRLIKQDDLNGFIERRAYLYHTYVTEGIEG